MGEKTSKSEVLKWAAMILCTIGIFLIPVNEVFTVPIKNYVAVTFAVVYIVAFGLLDLVFAAILLPCLYVMFGCATMDVAFSGWTAAAPVMVLGAYILTNILNECGLLKRIAYWSILRCPKSFLGLMFGIFLAGFILSVITSCNAFTVMPALGVGVCQALNLKKSKESALIMGAVLLSTCTVMTFIYDPSVMGLLNEAMQQVTPGFAIGWLQFFLQNSPMFIFCLITLVLYYKIMKPDIEIKNHDYFSQEYQRMGKMSSDEKKAGIVTLLLLVYIVSIPIHGMEMQWGFLFAPMLLYLPGLKVGTQTAIEKTNFSMVLFTVACIGIGKVSMSLGLGQILSDILLPMLTDMPKTGVLYIVWIVCTLVNFLFTPIAIVAAFAAPLVQVAMDLGMGPLSVLYTVILGGETIFLPYEVVPYLIIFGFGYMKMSDFIKLMVIKSIALALFIPLIMFPWYAIIGIM